MSYVQKGEVLEFVRRVVEAGNLDTRLSRSKTLHSRGKGIVDIVLEELFRLKESGALARQDSFGAFCLILSIRSYVEVRHAKRVAGVLLWDEVSLRRDGSTRHRLLEMLKQIGGVEEIPFLEQLSMKVKNVMYRDQDHEGLVTYLQECEQRHIRAVITAIRTKRGLAGSD